jgi:Uma2 family endonuclease
MSTLSTYRFDVSDFEKLYVAGILSEDDRIELLDGDLIRMAPIGGNHRTVVDLLGERLTDLRRGRYRVGIQNPIRLGEFSELLPDIALFPVEITGRHPGPDEVYLVIEVADASLMYDQGRNWKSMLAHLWGKFGSSILLIGRSKVFENRMPWLAAMAKL